MTKQEHIKEMVSIMAASNNPFIDVPIEIMPKIAEALYNAGYRKLHKDRSEQEQIVYGSLITSTKCYNCIHFPLCFAQKGAANLELASENDCCYYQSKLPIDSIVLSKEEYNLLINIKKFFETADSEISAGNLLVYLKELIAQERKETADKIYTKIKNSFLMDNKNRYKLKLWIKEQYGVDIYE